MNQNQITNYEHLETQYGQYGQYCIIDAESTEYIPHKSKKHKMSDLDMYESDRPKEIPTFVKRVVWTSGIICIVIIVYSVGVTNLIQYM